jgi:hypothetical protein
MKEIVRFLIRRSCRPVVPTRTKNCPHPKPTGGENAQQSPISSARRSEAVRHL